MSSVRNPGDSVLRDSDASPQEGEIGQNPGTREQASGSLKGNESPENKNIARQEAVQALAREADISADALGDLVQQLESLGSIRPEIDPQEHERIVDSEPNQPVKNPDMNVSAEMGHIPTPEIPSRTEVRKFSRSVGIGSGTLFLASTYGVIDGVLNPWLIAVTNSVLLLVCMAAASLYLNFDQDE